MSDLHQLCLVGMLTLTLYQYSNPGTENLSYDDFGEWSERYVSSMSRPLHVHVFLQRLKRIGILLRNMVKMDNYQNLNGNTKLANISS